MTTPDDSLADLPPPIWDLVEKSNGYKTPVTRGDRMVVLYIALYVVAALCFALAAFGVNSRVNLVGAGLLAWVLVPLIHTAHR